MSMMKHGSVDDSTFTDDTILVDATVDSNVPSRDVPRVQPPQAPGCCPVDRTPSTTTCEEDMDCWDCSTMGNHVCGTLPTATLGTVASTYLPATGRNVDLAEPLSATLFVALGVVCLFGARRDRKRR